MTGAERPTGHRHAIPLLKLCGIRDEAAASLIGGLPVDYAGFIFARSRRQVSPEQAGALIAALRAGAGPARGDSPSPLAVGVFVDASPQELEAALRHAPLQALQLHGNEEPELCRIAAGFGVPVWKALHADPDGTPAGISRKLGEFAEAGAEAFLLDTAGGGTGKTFDWSLIPAYQAAARSVGKKLFIAGGLHAGNVSSLIEQFSPDGIDVSSGVEAAGVKDPELIRAFTERVKPA
ncbi:MULTISPECIES: phosphoribosylanthranilate isomerase [Paenibacillus]|uniref:phosphoribosylanthranilate isomerase n=1 Tax=Paenibacillus TaxID=44249 RepID=UPI00038F8EFF|nr:MULTISPECIES: phosphoribosylanthranilate isomerase [Paenibacillus]CDN43902.1 N-(5'-phosphoribosyl)anthranilate isomerase [Paenibacillus sp. P22]